MPGSPSISRVASVESMHSDGTASTRYSSQIEDLTDYMLAIPAENEGELPVPTQPASASEPDDASYYRRQDDDWEKIDIWDLEPYTDTSGAAPAESASTLCGPAKRKREVDVASSSTRPSKVPKSASNSSSTSSPFAHITEKQPVVIAHSDLYCDLLHQGRWGVQWELARYVSAISDLNYSDLTFHELKMLSDPRRSHEAGVAELARILKERKGMMTSAAEDDQFISAFERERTARDPWDELDKEHMYFSNVAPGDLTYLHDAEDGDYGGKVHFTARLKFSESGNHRIELNRPFLGTSCRFSRRFGSHSFVRIRIDKDTIFRSDHHLVKYFQRPFIIGGWVFRAFYSKEYNVFLFKTNEVVHTIPSGSASPGQPGLCIRGPHKTGSGSTVGLSLLEFLQWHNDISLNSAQAMSKWSARLALGLSNSAPGVLIHPDDIHFIDDIISPEYSGKGKVPTELIMTDGCGLANREFFEALQNRFRWECFPTAVQVRIHGAKGLLLQHPKHAAVSKDGRPQIWLRDSQRKIQYADSRLQDPALFTVDVLRSSHLSYPSSLSSETIINFAENGVKFSVITDLIKASMSERIDDLTTWDGRDGLFRLWHYTALEGGVYGARLVRERVTEARLKGNSFKDLINEYVDDEDDDGNGDGDYSEIDRALTAKSSAWWWDPISGSPSSLEETSMALIDSGFDPASLPVLRAKQREVAKKSMKAPMTKFRAAVPMSCSAWAVPDPCGVLESGEIYVESSHTNLIDSHGSRTNKVLGDVLVTRNPCKVPTDVQRARAVDRPELRGMTDVVIVSTKGHVIKGEHLGRHLLSMTGGGDYDGDRVQVFWHPQIVQDFQSADKRYATEPESVVACLEKSDEPVEDFQRRIGEGTSESDQIVELQNYLLGSLRNASLVGTYSTYWESAMYRHGYFHHETIRLAYMFCAVLDGSKTGVTVTASQQKADKACYQGPGPAWKKPIESTPSTNPDWTNLKYTVRAPGLGRFIMDSIRRSMLQMKSQLEKLITERLGDPNTVQPDPHLTKPWEDLVSKARQADAVGRPWLTELMNFIKEQVEKVYAESESQKAATGAKPTSRKSVNKGRGSSFTDLPIEKRQDILRKQSQQFYSILNKARSAGFFEFSDEDILRYMASYAYLYDSQHASGGWSRFPWNVAFRTLCDIKARVMSNGFPKTVWIDFYVRFAMYKRAFESPSKRSS